MIMIDKEWRIIIKNIDEEWRILMKNEDYIGSFLLLSMFGWKDDMNEWINFNKVRSYNLSDIHFTHIPMDGRMIYDYDDYDL